MMDGMRAVIEGGEGGGRRRAEKRGFEIVLVLWVRNSYSTAALVQRVAQLVVGRSLLLLFWFWYIRTLSSPPWYPPPHRPGDIRCIIRLCVYCTYCTVRTVLYYEQPGAVQCILDCSVLSIDMHITCTRTASHFPTPANISTSASLPPAHPLPGPSPVAGSRI